MLVKHPILDIELKVERRQTSVKIGTLLANMRECGISVIHVQDIHPEHIVNCLEPSLVLTYLKRFLACTSYDEVYYIKSLARKGLFEESTLQIDGKEAKILPWCEVKQKWPMFVNKTKKGIWGKQKKVLYQGMVLTNYPNFNTPLKN